jgi:hypothetical protein
VITTWYCEICNLTFYSAEEGGRHFREHDLARLSTENNRLIEQNNKLLKILTKKLDPWKRLD